MRSYTTRYNLELGAGYRWNSGPVVNTTEFASNRRLPLQGATTFENQGTTDQWIANGAIGAVQNPSWGQLDLRIQYIQPIGHATAEVFMDLFNVTNNQGAIRLQDLAAGSGTTKYLDEFVWLRPQNAFLGARIRF